MRIAEIRQKEKEEKNTVKKYLPIGSYSERTMLVEDIVPELLYQLKRVNKRLTAKWQAEYNRMVRHCPENDHEFLNNLTSAMEQYCLPYTYIGSHPGDGADIGCWVSQDSLEDDINHAEDIVRVNAGDAWPKGQLLAHILETNDHGNMTLYDYKTRQEIWSIV